MQSLPPIFPSYTQTKIHIPGFGDFWGFSRSRRLFICSKHSKFFLPILKLKSLYLDLGIFGDFQEAAGCVFVQGSRETIWTIAGSIICMQV